MTGVETPEARAERLLLDVLGEQQFHRLRNTGYIYRKSGLYPGRIYQLDAKGSLSYKNPGENGFGTTLCVQPTERVPLDDMVAARYLLVVADEERLLATANEITFGIVSLGRALYRDFSMKNSAMVSWVLTAVVLLFFLLSFAGEFALGFMVLPTHPVPGVAMMTILALPALVGAVLILAAINDIYCAIQFRTYQCRNA